MVNRFRAAVLVTLPLLLAGSAAGMVSPAQAAPDSATAGQAAGATYLATSRIALTSSTGRHLHASIFMDRFTWQQRHPTTNDEVIVSRPHESHIWVFDLASSHFSFDAKTGRGHLFAASKSLGHFGRIDLRIRRVGSAKSSTCPNSPDTDLDTPVKLSGSFRFDTDSGKAGSLGAVGSRTRTTKFAGDSTIDTEFGDPSMGCFEQPQQPCAAQVNWQSTGGNGNNLDGGWIERHGVRHGFIDGARFANLPSLKAFRVDFAFHSAPVPQLRRTGDQATMRIKASGRPGVTGSVTLASTSTVHTSTAPCDTGTQDRQSWRASYTNGAKPLTLAEVLGGPITHRDGKHAGFLEAGVRSSTPASQGAGSVAAFGMPAGANAARSAVMLRLLTELERR